MLRIVLRCSGMTSMAQSRPPAPNEDEYAPKEKPRLSISAGPLRKRCLPLLLRKELRSERLFSSPRRRTFCSPIIRRIFRRFSTFRRLLLRLISIWRVPGIHTDCGSPECAPDLWGKKYFSLTEIHTAILCPVLTKQQLCSSVTPEPPHWSRRPIMKAPHGFSPSIRTGRIMKL